MVRYNVPYCVKATRFRLLVSSLQVRCPFPGILLELRSLIALSYLFCTMSNSGEMNGDGRDEEANMGAGDASRNDLVSVSLPFDLACKFDIIAYFSHSIKSYVVVILHKIRSQSLVQDLNMKDGVSLATERMIPVEYICAENVAKTDGYIKLLLESIRHDLERDFCKHRFRKVAEYSTVLSGILNQLVIRLCKQVDEEITDLGKAFPYVGSQYVIDKSHVVSHALTLVFFQQRNVRTCFCFGACNCSAEDKKDNLNRYRFRKSGPSKDPLFTFSTPVADSHSSSTADLNKSIKQLADQQNNLVQLFQDFLKIQSQTQTTGGQATQTTFTPPSGAGSQTNLQARMRTFYQAKEPEMQRFDLNRGKKFVDFFAEFETNYAGLYESHPKKLAQKLRSCLSGYALDLYERNNGFDSDYQLIKSILVKIFKIKEIANVDPKLHFGVWGASGAPNQNLT